MTVPADLIVENGLSPSRSVAADSYLLRRLGGPESGGKPTLRIYTLERPSLLLGRYQPVPVDVSPETLRPGDAHGIGRRLTGGRAVPAGPGFVGISLALPRAWDLAGDPDRILPPELVLNRYVRGVLRGCHPLGVKAVYMGRDVLTVDRKRIAVVGFTFSPEGAVLFECHLALSGGLAELEGGLADAPSGKPFASFLISPPVTSLRAESGREISIEDLAEAVRQGSERRLGLAFQERPWTGKEQEGIDRIRQERTDRAAWVEDRKPRPAEVHRAESEIQLGRFSAALARGEDGRIASVTLAGDFLSDDRTLAELEGALSGQLCDWTVLGTQTDQVLNRPGRFILGLGSRRVIPDTVLQAAG